MAQKKQTFLCDVKLDVYIVAFNAVHDVQIQHCLIDRINVDFSEANFQRKNEIKIRKMETCPSIQLIVYWVIMV